MAKQRSKSDMARLLREQERGGLAKLARMKQAERAEFWRQVRLGGSTSGGALARRVSSGGRQAKQVASRVLITPSGAPALGAAPSFVGPASQPIGPSLPGTPAIPGPGGGAPTDRRDFMARILGGDRAKALKRFAKTPEAKIMGATVMLDLLARSAMGIVGEAQEANQQGQALDLQGEFAPKIAEQQALQPVTESRKQQALMMLMRQMGQPMPNLAEGEVWT